MKENTTSSIQIDDMEPRVFKVLCSTSSTLTRYWRSRRRTSQGWRSICWWRQTGMANGMHRLKLMCEAMLLKHIDTSILATTLTLAEQHGCQGLKEGCFKFLRSPGNTKAVVETDGFQHLRSSCPSLIEEMLVKVAP
jgi:speckle-type POZ protein